MNGAPRTDRPNVTHRLAVALRFRDVFTNIPVAVPLSVSIPSLPPATPFPSLPWNAVMSETDSTYRFLVGDGTAIPAGNLSVRVEDPSGAYASLEPLQVQLPRPLVPHPPPVLRLDYLVQPPLWPARRFRPAPGETAVVGIVRSGGVTPVANLRVKIWRAGDPLPPGPYTYTNADGEFLFRLPGFRRSVSSTGVVTASASLSLDLRLPPAHVAAVAPIAPPLPFTIPLGRVALLEITVP